MQESVDAPPSLSVRVVTPERERWDRIGRLYRKPGVELPRNYQALPVLRQLIADDILVPSVTNVIGTLGGSHLSDWAARLVANEAVRVQQKWPTLINTKPREAYAYLKDVAYRELTHWGTQGTRVHYACEMLAKQEPIVGFTPTEYEQKCIDAFKAWLDDYQPVFNEVEIQGFGHTSDGLGFAGTADWHVTIDGVNVLGDTKCTTKDTRILLTDGTTVTAENVKPGDQVVSWDERTGTLVADEVTEVADNGVHDIYVVTTAFGQTLAVTGNHRFLIKDDIKGKVWRRADELQIGDIAYSAFGWSAATDRTPTPWNFNKHLSPYTFGVLWALAQFSETEWDETGKTKTPDTSSAELDEVLNEWGFFKASGGTIRLRTGLKRVAHKARIEVSELLALLNSPTLPDYVLNGEDFTQDAFISGIQTVFRENVSSDGVKNGFIINMRSLEALKQTQTLLFNNSISAWLGEEGSTQKIALHTHRRSYLSEVRAGGWETKITNITKRDPESTVAITVKNTHNHVTEGLITHNTNKSGLHSTIALQLAANRHMEHISPDGHTLKTPPTTDITAGLHLSPEGYKFMEVRSDEEMWNTFESLRRVWAFHAFDGLTDTQPLFTPAPFTRKPPLLDEVSANVQSAWDNL